MRKPCRIRFILQMLVCVCGLCSANVTIQSNPPTNGGIVLTNLDQTVSLTCTHNDSSAAQELQWFRNGKAVLLRDGNHMSTSHLCVQPVIRDDNKVIFTCQLKSDANVKASVQLDVQYPPTLGNDEQIQLEEKTDAVLSCDVQASPPVSVVWKKDDELLDLFNNYHTSNDGVTTTLFIPSVKRDINGSVYTCEANSLIYGVRRKNFSITVIDKKTKFPLGPVIAGVVVILCTILLATFSRWEKIVKCFKKD